MVKSKQVSKAEFIEALREQKEPPVEQQPEDRRQVNRREADRAALSATLGNPLLERDNGRM